MNKPMTSITDMDLPDSVAKAFEDEYYLSDGPQDIKAAIRAALQAMLDNGMAKIETRLDAFYHEYTVLIIRLDADPLRQSDLPRRADGTAGSAASERKREEQT